MKLNAESNSSGAPIIQKLTEKEQDEQKKKQAKEKKEKEIEDKFTKKPIFLKDIQNLNYKELNIISKKNGEAIFNPKDIIDIRDYDSDSEEEILKKFKIKSPNYHRNAKNGPQYPRKGAFGGNKDS